MIFSEPYVAECHNKPKTKHVECCLIWNISYQLSQKMKKNVIYVELWWQIEQVWASFTSKTKNIIRYPDPRRTKWVNSCNINLFCSYLLIDETFQLIHNQRSLDLFFMLIVGRGGNLNLIYVWKYLIYQANISQIRDGWAEIVPKIRLFVHNVAVNKLYFRASVVQNRKEK